eukprot:1183941-Prorocentrum_minimum.AAC.3
MKASNRDTSNPPRAANKECTTGPSWWGSPANTTAHVGFRVASERGMRLSGMVACITGIATRLPLTILRVPPTPSLINSSGQLKHSTVQSVQCSATVQGNIQIFLQLEAQYSTGLQHAAVKAHYYRAAYSGAKTPVPEHTPLLVNSSTGIVHVYYLIQCSTPARPRPGRCA